MTKEVRLTITGIQSGYGQEDVSEVTTMGQYHEKGGRRYLFYSEYTEEGQIIKNRLTIDPEYVELRKTGQGESASPSVLTFRLGQMVPCRYLTPMGYMELTSDTREIALKTREDSLILNLQYSLILHGSLMADYRLTIRAESLMNA